MRLDKYLCDMGLGSRSQIKEASRKGQISVNGQVCRDPSCQVSPGKDTVFFQGRRCVYSKYVYYMLNKPAGTVTATRDNTAPTVLSLFRDISVKDIFPVGRLDKDTEGLLILTNDGALGHRLTSPRHHADKTYLVESIAHLSEEDIRILEEGVDIGDDKPTLPARVERIDSTHIYLTLREGRFHQVKRMLHGVGNQVVYLKRVAMGGLELDGSLQKGEYRQLTPEEVSILYAPQILE